MCVCGCVIGRGSVLLSNGVKDLRRETLQRPSLRSQRTCPLDALSCELGNRLEPQHSGSPYFSTVGRVTPAGVFSLQKQSPASLRVFPTPEAVTLVVQAIATEIGAVSAVGQSFSAASAHSPHARHESSFDSSQWHESSKWALSEQIVRPRAHQPTASQCSPASTGQRQR